MKHKLKTILFIGLALIALFGMTGCPNAAGGGGDALADKTENVEGIQFTMKGIAAVTNGKIGHADQEHNGERTVSLTAYHIGQTEVTQDLWEAVMGGNPSAFSGGSNPPASGETQGARPVEQVNWYSAIAFCNKLSLKLGRAPVYSVTVGGTPVDFESLTVSQIPTTDNTDWNAVTADWSVNGFRLPTEAEWEWAAQDGSARRKWAGANDESALASCAWYRANGGDKTHAAGKKSANAFGLSDMSGNVQEWCWDWYSDLTPGGGEDPTGEAGGTKRSVRGGSWKEDAANAACAFRSGLEGFKAENTLGFRLVCRQQGKPFTGSYNKDTGAGQVGSVKFTMKKIDAVTNGTIGHSDQAAAPTKNPPHQVNLSSYCLGETEVTQELYEAVMGNNPSFYQGSGKPPVTGEVQAQRPVEEVSWYDAIAFCNELTKKTMLGDDACVYWVDGHIYNADDARAKKIPQPRWSKKGFRLPTEAEWEWAAQGGSERHKWAGTDNESALASYAWYYVNPSSMLTHQVKKKNANALGFFDMSGNVGEWCWDKKGELPDPLPDDYAGPVEGSDRICRGGSVLYDTDHAACAKRSGFPPDLGSYIGIRVAYGVINPPSLKPWYTVQFGAADEHGSLSATVAGEIVSQWTHSTRQEKDTVITFKAHPESDYVVKEWTNNGAVIAEASNAVVYNHTVTADADIKVSFKPQDPPVISFGVDGAHGTLKAYKKNTNEEILSGEQVPLRSNVYFIAKPESGYTVDKWTNNGATCNGTSWSYELYATEDTDIRVQFKAKTYTVRFGAEGGGTVSVTVDGTSISSPCEVREGKQVVFSATPNEGYRLKKWTRNGNEVYDAGTAPTYTYTVNSDVDVKAHFLLNNAWIVFCKASGKGRVKAYVNGNEIQSGTAVPHGTQVRFSAWPFDHSAIDKWELNGSELTETGVGIEYTRTVEAHTDMQQTLVKVYFSEPDWDKFFTAAGVRFKMRCIAPVENGTVGSNDVDDNHEHTISLSTYYIADTEVTQELYQAVMGDNPSFYNDNPLSGDVQEKRPVENVTWYKAVLFCNELTEKAGLPESECVYWCEGQVYTFNALQNGKEPEMRMEKRGFRLPTEAEWEWAAQDQGKRRTWAGTNDESSVGTYAWHQTNSTKTREVKNLRSTDTGLYDMSGNVAEWCWDWYTDTTPAGGINPTGAQSGNKHAIRGGSYNSSASGIKCAFRDKSWNGDKDVGLRVVKRP
ncbi:SUMF1/EgtB/PvdO family nonheme iron enzyme [Treponema socranskii subsp. buccale]|uniref:SUMF1/EgtB/PvdO family nonheme iron enzyme n=1 Tax=Treponema socranskii TaxID=53419 RepID=UPI0020A52818|nr:SUMF1/EgtB/PvdO family nonheme iron enzyme [Treponema socranskii]UTD03489.1 SUMF1/EgtB/PvdO family nonheme iron enzyme [Treponema socranskii subsp. buccale]